MAEQLPTVETIADHITLVRGQRVMLDADLARLYEVRTERLNQQVRRNLDRFPEDFMFRLAQKEWRAMCLQNASTSPSRRRRDYAPLAFTEHGCLMLSNVLRSPRAVEVSVLVVRAFVRMRGVLAANAELAARVDELGRELEKQGGKLATHDQAILKILAEIQRLTRFPEPTRRGIGFTSKW
jgi:phage regulator Rha-like protein